LMASLWQLGTKSMARPWGGQRKWRRHDKNWI
jgi:hypothetical protein